ncbi:hypothetical protein NN561_007673 [Cricetulus griseus]
MSKRPAGGRGGRERRECGRIRSCFSSESPGFGRRRLSLVPGSECSTSHLLHPLGKSPKQAQGRPPRVCNNAGSHGAHTLM